MAQSERKNAMQMTDAQARQVRTLLANLAYVEVSPEQSAQGHRQGQRTTTTLHLVRANDDKPGICHLQW